MKPTLMILAAGMGSRYGGLKQLDRLGPSGETIMDYSIYDAKQAGFGKIVFVIRKSFEEEFKEIFVNKLQGQIEVELAFQELDNVPSGIAIPEGRTKPFGTGHAILVAKDVVKEPFVVINADDFYGAEAFKTACDFLLTKVSETKYAMCGYELGNTLSDFGTVSRGVCVLDSDDYLETVVERTSISNTEGRITYQEDDKAFELQSNDIVSMNFWAFDKSIFTHLEEKFTAFIKENSDNIKSEFYIPFVVDDLMKEGKVKAKVLKSNASWFGVTYKEDRPATVEKLQDLVKQGVYPEKLW